MTIVLDDSELEPLDDDDDGLTRSTEKDKPIKKPRPAKIAKPVEATPRPRQCNRGAAVKVRSSKRRAAGTASGGTRPGWLGRSGADQKETGRPAPARPY